MKVMSSDRKRIYDVTSSSCTCPDYLYRQAKTGSKCKHMLKHFGMTEPVEEAELKKEIKQLFRNGYDFDIAYQEFGDKIDDWIKQALICESNHKGKRMFFLLE